MAAELSIHAEGNAQIERTLFGLVTRFGDISPLMERFGTVLETSTIERFNDEQAPDGSKWLPSFRARTTGGKTLTDTARLKLSIRSIAGPSSVETGSNVIYARAQNDGATISAKGGGMLAFKIPGLGLRFARSVTLPKRQFIGLSVDDREELDAQVVDYVAEVAPDVES